MITIIVLLSTVVFSCTNTAEQRVLEAVLDSEVVKSEFSNIPVTQNIVLNDVSKYCTSESYMILFNGTLTEVTCDKTVLDSIKDHSFNKSNKMLFLVSIERLERWKYEVNISHPNSGLLITTNVKMSKDDILIENSKVYSM